MNEWFFKKCILLCLFECKLNKITNINQFLFVDCSAVDDGGLRVIVRNCPQLVYLYLRRCIKITGI